MNDVETKVIEIIAESLRIDKSKITPQSRIVNDLGADSLDTVEVMMAIEAAFNCDIPDEEASKIVTVADAVNYVQQKVLADNK